MAVRLCVPVVVEDTRASLLRNDLAMFRSVV